MFIKLINVIVDIIFPKRCPVCGDIVAPKSGYICNECHNKLQVVKEPRCKKCSKPIESEEAELCYDCSTKHFEYTNGYAMWIYDGIMKKSISDFKYKGRREYAAYYSDELIRYYGRTIKEINPDALIPIPLFREKQVQRGFNQAEVLAKAIGKRLDIPVINILIRDKKTLPQKELNDKERFNNLLKAFKLSEKNHWDFNQIKRVILVDDIYTTGSTIEACSRVLKQAGAQEVYFLSLCIGKGF